MSTFKTEQEDFWAGEFGNDYIQRNKNAALDAGNLAFFSKALSSTNRIKSVLEFGANIGNNLMALKNLLPASTLHGIEINEKASTELADVIGKSNVYNTSILDFDQSLKADLVLIKGVLIHLNPDVLQEVYKKLYECSNRYILIAEYFNPNPVEINYRGHSGRLFKRDFAGEMLDAFNDLELLDYGFVYSRDNNFSLDNINWFLLQKS